MRYTLNNIIYRRVIDPILSPYYRTIIDELRPGDRVLDIASGTGSLALRISVAADFVTGIDLSEEMIELSTWRADKKKINNIRFMLRDASELSNYREGDYDLAVTSMAIHQFDPDLAFKILKEMKRIAGRVIIMDYNRPITKHLPRLAVYTVERIAGGDHYRNFRKYNERGGLNHYLEEAGMKIAKEKLAKNATFRVVVCE